MYIYIYIEREREIMRIYIYIYSGRANLSRDCDGLARRCLQLLRISAKSRKSRSETAADRKQTDEARCVINMYVDIHM